MAITTMTWLDLENVVADSVLEKYDALITDKQKSTFCRNLRIADQNRLNSYALVCAGESYALWFHLTRADNICVGFDALHKVHPLSPNLQVLDIGSGTGSGMTALSFWIAKTFDATPTNFCVHCVEPADTMRQTASYILPAFLKKLETTLSVPTPASTFNWHHCKNIKTWEQCADATATKKFDLILFSYTFPVQSPSEWDQTIKQIIQIASKQLKRTGALTFLTPKSPPEKIEFMKAVREHLTRNGMTRLKTSTSSIPYAKQFHPKYDRHPIAIKTARDILNREHEKFYGYKAFREDIKNDYPYYGFYCELDAFVWKT